MKKLFALRKAATGRVLDGDEYQFEKKEIAKQERQKLNPKSKEGKEIFEYVITLGVDHRDYVSEDIRKEQSGKHHGTTPRVNRSREEYSGTVHEDQSGDVARPE